MKDIYYYSILVSFSCSLLHASEQSFKLNMKSGGETTYTVILHSSDLKKTYVPKNHSTSIHESYECVLSDRFPLPHARVFANRYGDTDKIQCYLMPQGDSHIFLLPTYFFYIMKQMAEQNHQATIEVMDKVLQSSPPPPTLPERPRSKKPTKLELPDRLLMQDTP